MVQETSNTNSDRKSNELVWKFVESIIWDWNVSSVVFICAYSFEYPHRSLCQGQGNTRPTYGHISALWVEHTVL